MERMSGTPLSDFAGLTNRMLGDVLRQVGQCLRQPHAITGHEYGYVGAHRPMEPQGDWASAYEIMWNKLLDDIQRCGGYNTDEADFMRRLLDQHAHVFDHQVAPSLLYMDVWAQNILADDRGKLTGLLDWDRVLWGDPEIEFAVLDYCGISEPAFWEGYRAERTRSPEAQIRRVFYLLYELQKYIFIRRVRRNRPVEAERFRQQSLDLTRSLAPGNG